MKVLIGVAIIILLPIFLFVWGAIILDKIIKKVDKMRNDERDEFDMYDGED